MVPDKRSRLKSCLSLPWKRIFEWVEDRCPNAEVGRFDIRVASPNELPSVDPTTGIAERLGKIVPLSSPSIGKLASEHLASSCVAVVPVLCIVVIVDDGVEGAVEDNRLRRLGVGFSGAQRSAGGSLSTLHL